MRRSVGFLLCMLAGTLFAQSFEDEFHRGLLALSGNNVAQARQRLESASRLQPDNPMVWAALAQTYLRGKDDAIDAFLNYLAACLHAKALGAASGDTTEIEAGLRRSIRPIDGYWESRFEL